MHRCSMLTHPISLKSMRLIVVTLLCCQTTKSPLSNTIRGMIQLASVTSLSNIPHRRSLLAFVVKKQLLSEGLWDCDVVTFAVMYALQRLLCVLSAKVGSHIHASTLSSRLSSSEWPPPRTSSSVVSFPSSMNLVKLTTRKLLQCRRLQSKPVLSAISLVVSLTTAS